MEEEKVNEEQQIDHKEKKILKLSPFSFIMILLSSIIITAAITAFAILFGNNGEQQTVQAPKRSEFLKLYEVYDKLNKDYYKDVDSKKLIDSAIKGMMTGLDDPYSEYMTGEETTEFNESMTGDFQGIGAEMGQDNGKVIITSPIKGSPAEKAGIKPNDVVIAIDDKTTEGLSSAEVVKKIRGKKGTKVTLTIKRSDQSPFDVAITRDIIHLNSVESKMLKNNVALITVTKFQEGTADEFHKALSDMSDKGMKKLVLDFRNNPGGYLNEAEKMVEEFLDKGDVLYYTERHNEEPKPYKAKTEPNNKLNDIPTVIILNEGSASASEVFSEALRENNKARIVGTKSFGKGIVQNVIPFKDDSIIKFTEMKWLTPSKNWIQKKGVTPDIEAKLPEYADIHILNPDEVLSNGEKGDNVKSLEIGLKALGYNPGKIDNIFDDNTEQSVVEFQIDNDLEMTGTMHDKATTLFNELLRKKLSNNDTQLSVALKELQKEK